jgi:ADP-ribose pyrophosphatase YjhB (NUDIX family)
MSTTYAAGIIIKCKDGKYLLGKATNHKEPCWTIFKGCQEDKELLRDTAIRETKEESGIDIKSDAFLLDNLTEDPIYSYHVNSTDKDVYVFMLEDKYGVLDKFQCKCTSFFGEKNIPEITDFQRFSLSELKDKLFPSQLGLIKALKIYEHT